MDYLDFMIHFAGDQLQDAYRRDGSFSLAFAGVRFEIWSFYDGDPSEVCTFIHMIFMKVMLSVSRSGFLCVVTWWRVEATDSDSRKANDVARGFAPASTDPKSNVRTDFAGG